MPLYSYRCLSCQESYDAMKSFADADKEDICPKCGGKAVRVFNSPAAVIYKGSGYYCTDNPHSSSCSCKECKGGR